MPKAKSVRRGKRIRIPTIPTMPYTIEEVEIKNGLEVSFIHRLKGPRISQWGDFGTLAHKRLELNIAYAEGAKAAKKGRAKCSRN